MIFFRIFEYLRFRWQAKNAHGIHSPFVFAFYNKVLRRYRRIIEVEAEIKKRYLKNTDQFFFKDPKTGDQISTTLSALAKRTWSGKSFSYFLIKLCEWLGAKCFLETGTALGITFSMVSHSKGLQSIHSIEGSDVLAEKARQLSFTPHEVKSSIIQGEVKQVFRQVLEDVMPDVVFLDADHRSETIHFYMSELKRSKSPVKAIIIHDIYWSRDMKSAWKRVVNDPDFSLTIDCFHAGLVFPLQEMEKQHFIVKY